MSEPLSASSTRGRGPRRAALGAAAGLLLAAVASAGSLVRVPEGSHALRRLRGASSWDLLEPGRRLRLPLVHELLVVPDRFEIQETLALTTPEGARLDVACALAGGLGSEALRRIAGAGATPRAFVLAAAGAALRAEAARIPGGDLASGRADGRLAAALEGALEAAAIMPESTRARVIGPQGAARRRLDHPILLVGLDGADWQVAGPLMEAGRLPALKRLSGSGLRGHLRSSVPMLSPLLWTTAATGKPPEEHGIVDFLVPDRAAGRRVPITSSHRRVKALWNIFSERGYEPAVVAWWATYPAEAVRGAIVSDRVAYSLFDVGEPDAAGPGLVHPPDLWPRVREARVDPADVADAEVTRLARVAPAEIAAARAAASSRAPGSSKDRLVHLLKILAAARTYHAVARDLLERGRPDLLALYYQGIDEVSHRFAHCSEPALPLCAPADRERYGRTVEAFYERQDEMLGEILALAPPDAYVVVISDHGFRSGGDRPRDVPPDLDGKPAKWHRPYGIVLVSGPGLEAGDLKSATLLDVAPTILRLAGLPRAEDMTGRALVAAGGIPEPPEPVATYEGAASGAPPALAALAASEDPGAAGADEEMLENLRSLGYVGPEEPAPPGPAAPAAPSGTPSTITAHTNVGALRLQKGQAAEAAREFEAALAIAGDYFPALMGLAEAKLMMGEEEAALGLMRAAMERGRSPEPGVYVRYAQLAARRGRPDEAAEALARLRAARPDVAEIPAALAFLADLAGRTGEAERLLAASLDMDPAGAEAMTRLFQIKRKAGREAELEGAVRRALAANPASVLHRNFLGLILQARGDHAAAEREFTAALRTAPDFAGTMANLGSLYGRTGRLEEAVEILGRALRIDPDNVECRVNLGAALGKLGRTDEAIRALRGGEGRGRPQPEILNALAVAYADRGDLSRARALVLESLALSPDQPRTRALLGRLEEADPAPPRP
jgi:tetratricopeptide (TPR) repeat protein